MTGRPGPSHALFPFQIYSGAPGTLTIASDCGGDVSTGEADFESGSPFVLGQPLQHFGPCEVTSARVSSGDITQDLADALYAGLGYDVGPSEPAAPSIEHPPWTIDDAMDKTATWGDHSAVVVDALQNSRDRCVFFGQPGIDSLPACDRSGGGLLYTPGFAPTGPDTPAVFAHGAGWLNPLGAPDPQLGELERFSTAPLFGNTVFPCGPGAVGLTVCAAGHEHTDSGGYVVVSAVMAEDVPLEPSDDIAVEVAITGGQTYRLEAADGEWSLASPADTDARFVIRGDSVTLVVPQREAGSADRYQLATGSGGEMFGQPETPILGALAMPVIAGGAEDPPTSDPAAPTETPADFFTALTASISSGDTAFAFDRLHPLVIDTFGADTCARSLQGRVDAVFRIDVVAVGSTGPWAWVLPDGRSFDVPVALTVTIDLTRAGATTRNDAHIVDVDGTFRWFTICD